MQTNIMVCITGGASKMNLDIYIGNAKRNIGKLLFKKGIYKPRNDKVVL